MKKKIALLLCSTGNEAFAAGNVIIGAKKYLFQNLKDEEYDIIFYTDKLEPNDENALKKIFRGIIIKIYQSPFSKKMMDLKELNNFSVFAYARFEAFNLLDNYQKVFYTDTDIVIQKDISEIININKNISTIYFPNKMPISGNFTDDNIKLVKKYDLNKISIIDAVLLINDNLERHEIMTEWCYKKAEEYKTNDQSIINLLIQEFNIEVYDLTESYGAYPTSKIANEAHIIHAIGPQKFWRGTYNKYWEENNKIWIEAGGNQTYEENNAKRKKIDKIVWWIPTFKLRDKVRRYLLRKSGLTGR
ncbi:glycosyl transferase family 8 [Brachyspira hampsonii]|uniref:Glycosyl transferase family 8 n=1 Tax=Brachyspira hampsonii TaxID=1287055 RepID=A0AAC9TWI5_9SPIR|nr:glycosyltransferase [Brachyspira hampsonii]ASJ22299.1 glycosyl transferase family 8 [Brachyspira hampsonii]MBW5408947.1 glycosyl transferase family 8 [Brachyspira hampsonii]OEJ19156.1 glycosyl transferase family 8 [Brachyspira hampsonii]